VLALARADRWEGMLEVLGNELVVDGGWERHDLRIVVIASNHQGSGV
jgi:hypothetical protein